VGTSGTSTDTLVPAAAPQRRERNAWSRRSASLPSAATVKGSAEASERGWWEDEERARAKAEMPEREVNVSVERAKSTGFLLAILEKKEKF